MLKTVGAKWEQREHKRRLSGLPPRYRIVMAHDQFWSKGSLQAYATLAADSSKWIHLPDRYRTHDFAMMLYRGVASLSAAAFALQVKRGELHPFRGFGILPENEEVRLARPSEVLWDFHHRPCIMDPWFLALVRK